MAGRFAAVSAVSQSATVPALPSNCSLHDAPISSVHVSATPDEGLRNVPAVTPSRSATACQARALFSRNGTCPAIWDSAWATMANIALPSASVGSGWPMVQLLDRVGLAGVV